MSLIASELYKVLKQLGVKEEQAEKACAEVLDFDKKVGRVTEELDRKIYNLQKDSDSNCALLRKDIENLHKAINCKFNILTTLFITLFGGILVCAVGAVIAFFLK